MDLARVRWDNMAKLGAVLAVIAVIVLWPRLGATPEPVVPDGRARPVAAESVPAASPPRERPRRAPRPARSRGGRDRRKVRQAHTKPIARRAKRPRPPVPAPPAPPVSAPATPAAYAPPSEEAVAASEFGVEP
jgi:hypothetical protein